MNGLNVVNRCNHHCLTTKVVDESIEIYPVDSYDYSKNPDVFNMHIPNDYKIKKINKVYLFGNGKYSASLVEGVDYSVSLEENTIYIPKSKLLEEIWEDVSSGEYIVPKIFIVKGFFIHSEIEDYSLNPINCPRCAGYGWYVDIFAENNSGERNVICSGEQKLIGDVIKILFTEDNGEDYGCTLKNIPGKAYGSVVDFKKDLSDAIYMAEQRLIKLQQQFIINGGSIPDDERLSSIEIDKVQVDNTKTVYSIDISIVTTAEITYKTQINL